MSYDDHQLAVFYAMQLRNFGLRMAELITFDHMADQNLVSKSNRPYAPVYTEINNAWRDFVALVEYLHEEPPWRAMIDEEIKAVNEVFKASAATQDASIAELERKAVNASKRRQVQDTVILEQIERIKAMIELLIGQDLTHKERDGQLKLLQEYAERDMQYALLHPDGIPF